MQTSEKLVAFSKEQPARLLATYLSAQGILSKYQHTGGDYAHTVQLKNACQERRAKQIAEEFLLNPNDEKYQSAAWQTGDSVELVPQKSMAAAKVLWSLKQAPFTAVILIVSALTFLLANIGITAPYSWLHIQPFSYIAESGQWWRLFGPALIHFSLLHIAFNLLWWWSLGAQIERLFGFSSICLLFLFSAIVSNIAQLLISGPNFGGLSGVVYALVGCVWWLGWLKPQWGVGLPKPIIGFMLVWLMIGFMDVLPINMANTAHTTGLVCGCLFAWIFAKYSNKNTT